MPRSWLKCQHPDVFCAALLNAQPMGFYAPAQIVRDAREHGVEVRPVCVNASPLGLHAGADGRRTASPCGSACAWCAVSPTPMPPRIVAARADRPFTSVDDLWRRAGVPVVERWSGSPRPTPSGRRSALPAARRSGRSRRCATSRCRCSPPPRRAEAATVPEADEPAVDAAADDRRRRGGRGLRPCRPDAARPPGRLPARRSRSAGASSPAPRRCGRRDGSWLDDRRPGAGAPDAGLGQGRHVHHHRGRDRHRQPGRLAEPVRAAAPRDPRPPACWRCRAASSARARSSI